MTWMERRGKWTGASSFVEAGGASTVVTPAQAARQHEESTVRCGCGAVAGSVQFSAVQCSGMCLSSLSRHVTSDPPSLWPPAPLLPCPARARDVPLHAPR